MSPLRVTLWRVALQASHHLYSGWHYAEGDIMQWETVGSEWLYAMGYVRWWVTLGSG